MKKFFTLIALLSVFLGAKAEWVEVYKVDYSTFNGFPYYVMGYVPEWVDGVMTDLGGNYKYAEVKEDATETSDVIITTNSGVQYYRLPNTEGTWHQYFIATGIPTEIDGTFSVKAMVRASESCQVPVQMRWSWSADPVSATATIGTEWEEVEWEFSGIGGASCDLIAQPNTAAQIEWKYLTVTQNKKETRPVEWLEQLTNGDAEKAWEDPNIRFNDQEKNFTVCAWGKEKGRNMNENGGWDPFPCDIVEEADGNHAFIVRAKTADSVDENGSDAPSAWDNQFWIQSPQSWKSGTQVKIHFRYKANRDGVKTNTQIHKQNPSDYLIWHAIGDVTFSTEWQEFDGTMTFQDDMAGGWSIAFNLNPEVKDPVDFYFDDLSWQIMKLDEGLFVAGSNPDEGLEYDLDNATPFEFDAKENYWTATVGEKNAYVSQVMISTVRGNDAAFKSSTIKPVGTITNDPEGWLDYTEASLAKLNLPGVGIWKIYIDTDQKLIAFEMTEGTSKEPIKINPNPTVVVVHGLERDDLADNQNDDGTVTVREEEGGSGQPWDNQFFIVANRELKAGEATIIEFDYVATREAKTTTQCHTTPGNYKHWAAIGDVNFTPEEQHFSATFTVSDSADGMQSIAFNMAEIREACDYTIKNVVWKLEDGTESLINQEGADNFYVKEGAGTSPYIFGTGIANVVIDKAASNAVYNLAGQRVSKDYKGIVVKNGSKYIVK